jgi:adenine-specific DNA-methyltransferase
MSRARKRETEHVARTSAELAGEQLKHLKGIFPECFAEGRVDFDKLRATLGEEIDSRPERYSFTWAGKRDAIRLLQTPSRATLIPCPKESVNFEETGNLFIEGENLEVLKLLYKAYFGRVKMIYTDPPYNDGNDFIYPDNFADPLDTYLRLTGQKDNGGNLLTSNPETSGRYHSVWLSMMYPRLFLARQLLREDGVVLVSISDTELPNLLMIMNEIFGEENQVGIFLWKSRAKPTNAGDAIYRPQRVGEYVIAYGRNASGATFYPLMSGEKRTYPHSDPGGRRYRTTTILTSNLGRYRRETMRFKIDRFTPPENQRWKAGFDVIKKLYDERYLEFKDGTPFHKHYEDEEKDEHDPLWTFLPEEWTGTAETGKSDLSDLVGTAHGLDSVKPVGLIKILLQALTMPGDIVMDFFAGSCTTAHAVLELNHHAPMDCRRFIMVQLPHPIEADSVPYKAGFRTIAEIGKRRVREIAKRLAEPTRDQLHLGESQQAQDLGFKVFKLAESNYKAWTGVGEKDSEAYARTMKLYTDPLVPGWKPENVIWEVVIKEGFGLNSTIEHLSEIKGNTVYQVSDPERSQSFRICLDDALKPATLKALNLSKDDLFICRDKALDDEAAANLALQCRLKTI